MDKTDRVYPILVAAPRLKASGDTEVLEKDPSYRLIFASTAPAVIERLKEDRADVVVIELELPGLDITDMIIKIRSIDPDLPLLVVAECEDKRFAENLWEAGIDDGVCHPISSTELAHRVARSLKLRRLNQFCYKLEQENKGLWKLSITDGLTKLMNRRHFNDVVKLEFSRAKRYGGSLGCIMIDIDRFKAVNDTYGHLTGDRVLRELSGLIRNNLRRIDIAARYGGEEFVLLLPETDGEALGFVAEKLRKAVESHNFQDKQNAENPGPERITISLGAADFPQSGVKTPEDLVQAADQALYEAKRSGRNRVVVK